LRESQATAATLKGGARMAGITPMGDLSHELETLVMSVDNGEVTADVAVFDVIQRAWTSSRACASRSSTSAR